MIPVSHVNVNITELRALYYDRHYSVYGLIYRAIILATLASRYQL